MPARTQQPGARIDVSRLGPQVGQVVPDFRLQDGQGKVWTRDSIAGPNGAMLVFSRSLAIHSSVRLTVDISYPRARSAGTSIRTASMVTSPPSRASWSRMMLPGRTRASTRWAMASALMPFQSKLLTSHSTSRLAWRSNTRTLRGERPP